ncbi:bifunctional 2-dehydro-3-deoxygluconokinase/2-dehydro-3-deoxygalactonokinase [Natrialbaceae archaeon AArc-T1-2]|uniref:bifunctional 2-dehydro-3-deoxygluconokinase/2-dehydro-3- deoxygalactonokinase n=1 Tax=Natrialbaceae archaeon AArc-T1-2 TaxID=3053904 RepID=UPI00255ABCC4|nr:bifunctional 2-dehydro-3-deoxygluconokinase/2-dehydro-3-deoxygalactonokinase [Natrialbaceae archaeon AArc-T1-2]WIV65819.1 bifunctional 2-dehydro-3-deoxygluconokinase/2-dehydro-3-deoxygalactonokinase [Natrialbaceae archaeon AArc-T1-2]
MTDLVTFGETMLRLSPPRHERLETATALDVHPGGAESNVAVAASRLGVDATWLSKLPDSPLGRRVVSDLNRYGLEADVVWSDSGRQGTYYLEIAGGPRGTNVVYDRADAAVTTATADELPTETIRDAELFLTSGITPALSATLERTVTDLLEIAREADTRTAFDVNYRSKLWSPSTARETLETYFPLVDVLVTPARDARTVLGAAGDAGEIATALDDEWDFETVIVTRGADGAVASHENSLVERPAFEAETIAPIGTGDAFVGGFLASRLAGDDVGTALEYGTAVGALKRTIPGDVAIVDRAEVERIVAGAHATISR